MTFILEFSPPVIAHRGASGYAPENTLASFNKAFELGIQWIEFDVMSSSCGEAIVFHDDKLDRITGKRGKTHSYTFANLQTLDAGSWFHPSFNNERIPSLQQIIVWMREKNMNANIEIKAWPGTEENLVKKVLYLLDPLLKQSEPQILFSSFSVETLKLLKKYYPSALLGLLMHKWFPNWQQIVDSLGCVSVHVNEKIMNKNKAKEIKSMGKYLLCYTVNNVERAKILYSWGVDALFSDVPDKISKSLGGRVNV